MVHKAGLESDAAAAGLGQPMENEQSDDSVPTAQLLRAALEVALARVPGPLVLAISGGRDSMALMRAVALWAPDRLAAVATFDHGTGGYATAAAALVATDARRLGLTVVRERARTSAQSEAGWRDARWRFLRRVAKAYGARVATAHTRDDQAETIVMRLMRGAGTRGLAALAAPSDIVRPWLPVARAEVAAWATAEGIPFLDDPMNASRQFQRGRVRHELLPALEAVRPGITATMLELGERAAAWRRDLETYVDAMGMRREREGIVRVPAAVFAVRCLELCQHGPHVVLHGVKGEVPETCRAPDGGVAYDGVDPATMRRIVADHVAAGLPVRAALHKPQEGRGPVPQR